MANYQERKSKLLQQMDSAKQKIEKLTTKRAQEIGQLAMAYQLEDLDDDLLRNHFKDIAVASGKNVATNEQDG